MTTDTLPLDNCWRVWWWTGRRSAALTRSPRIYECQLMDERQLLFTIHSIKIFDEHICLCSNMVVCVWCVCLREWVRACLFVAVRWWWQRWMTLRVRLRWYTLLLSFWLSWRARCAVAVTVSSQWSQVSVFALTLTLTLTHSLILCFYAVSVSLWSYICVFIYVSTLTSHLHHSAEHSNAFDMNKWWKTVLRWLLLNSTFPPKNKITFVLPGADEMTIGFNDAQKRWWMAGRYVR